MATLAMTAQSLTAREAAAALAENAIVLVDLRTPGEWAQTGVPEGAWPIDLSDPGFRDRSPRRDVAFSFLMRAIKLSPAPIQPTLDTLDRRLAGRRE
jgi:rhodanese-related sulfurtransferase